MHLWLSKHAKYFSEQTTAVNGFKISINSMFIVFNHKYSFEFEDSSLPGITQLTRQVNFLDPNAK
jgi:hypothetical protein